MAERLKSILLLDDNLATNFIHKKFIEKSNCTEQIIEFRSGVNALNYLKQDGITQPDMIMVDINMPVMSAWEFLEKYESISGINRNKTKVVLLSTSLSPRDKEKADKISMINDIMLKPLTVDSIQRVVEKLFG